MKNQPTKEMTAEESLCRLYDRTMRNCIFYKAEGKEKCLLNEIGVLRGIAYCMEDALPGNNAYLYIDDHVAFHQMLAEQERLLADEKGQS